MVGLMRHVHTLLVAAALLAGVPARAFEPTGEVIFSARGAIGAGASFDEERLVGPSVNLTRVEGGGWAGDLGGQNLHLTANGDKLVGPNVTVVFERNAKGRIRLQGSWYGTRFRVDIDGKKAHGRFGTCSLDLKQTAPGFYRGDVGCFRGSMPATSRASLKLLGEAATGNSLPQLALALLAVLPS
jgi:hypothetical protein